MNFRCGESHIRITLGCWMQKRNFRYFRRQLDMTNGSDKVFNGNMCIVCRVTAKEKKLRKCGSCELVSYCGESHQKMHWKRHGRLCRVVQKINSVLRSEFTEGKEAWYSFRTKILMLCEIEMRRKLSPCEMNMILFPNNCQICHSTSNLQTCLECLCVNYCSDDHRLADAPEHKDICQLFALSLEIDLYLDHNQYYPDYFLGEKILILGDSMNSFISNNLTLEKISSLTLPQESALVSELITCPLSLLHGANLTSYKFKEKLILHIVGCSFLEAASLKSWELILHSQPEIQHLEIHFVGPEVQENYVIELCQVCQGKLTMKFSESFYHEYLNSSAREDPSIICIFNCGFHEYENTDLDTWEKSLPYLIQNPKIPLIFTSFTEDEAEKDVRRLLSLEKNLKVQTIRNKFSSLRPYRDLEKLGIYFNNGYLCTVSREPQ